MRCLLGLFFFFSPTLSCKCWLIPFSLKLSPSGLHQKSSCLVQAALLITSFAHVRSWCTNVEGWVNLFLTFCSERSCTFTPWFYNKSSLSSQSRLHFSHLQSKRLNSSKYSGINVITYIIGASHC